MLIYKKICTGFLCLCSLLMFCMRFDQPGMKIDFFSMTIIFAALYYVDVKIDVKINYHSYLQNVVCILLAFLWLVSEGLAIDNTIKSLYSTPLQIVKSIVYVLGATHLLNRIGSVFHELIAEKSRTCSIPAKKVHPFLFWFMLMLIVWMPHTIVSHPASIECDAWDSLYQFFGKAEFTAHHPPIFTVLLGLFASFGLSVGNINIAFFMWTMLQTVLCAAVMAYALVCISGTLRAPRWLSVSVFIIAAVSPFYTCYVTTIVKDTMFSFAVLLYMIELIYMHVNLDRYWKCIGHVGLFSLANIVMILFRHNGKYVIYVMTVYILIRYVRNKMGLTKRYIMQGAVLLILPVLLSNGILYGVQKHYHVTVQEGESMREALSIPFQQSARYAKYYDSETPEEEKAAIDRVIDYYALAGVYEPEISDPVKARFHYYATKEDWINYFKVWLKQFTRHPLTYVGATVNQNYYLIFPKKVNSRFYDSTYVDYFYDHAFMDEVGAAKEMTFAKANKARIELYKLLHSLPITGAFSNIAVYNIIFIFLIIYCIIDKKKDFLWIILPIGLSDLIVLAGPAIYDNVRYALPVVYTVPLALAYYIHISNQNYADDAS